MASQARDLRAALEAKKRIEADLAKVEQQVYNLETAYFDETSGYDLVRGLQGFDKCVHTSAGSEVHVLSPVCGTTCSLKVQCVMHRA